MSGAMDRSERESSGGEEDLAMAQQQQQRPPGVVGRVLGKDDPDSVDLEFGNEYSEETLNILRMIDRPAYLEETSSLDPVDDLSQYVEHQLALPPAAYDTLQDVGQDQLRELERLGKEELDPAAQDAIRYRQRLAQGASHQDLTWLKLRAYHRAMDKLALADQQERRQVEAQRLQEYEVPTDRVPPELLHLTPAQLAARQRLAVAAEQRAKQRRDAVQRILAAPEPSEESEWAVPPKQLQGSGWQLPPWAQEGVRLALAQHLEGGWRLLAPAAPGAAPADEAAAAASTSGRAGQEHEGAAAGRQERRQLRTIYTQAYLDQQELQRRVRTQQRQRTAAFWLSFLAVAGAYTLRLVRRGLSKKKPGSKGGGSKAGAAPGGAGARQPRPSDVSVASSAARLAA